MTASELVVSCCSLDVGLSVENGQLIVDDPLGLLTEKFKLELQNRRPEVAALLGTMPTAEMAALVAEGESAHRRESRAHELRRREPAASSRGLAAGVIVACLALGVVAILFFGGLWPWGPRIDTPAEGVSSGSLSGASGPALGR